MGVRHRRALFASRVSRVRPDPADAAGVRVWRVDLDRAGARRGWRLLSCAERERALAFADPVERRRYVVAHAALRTVLGGLCGVPADRLGFGRDGSGRPCLLPLGRRPVPDFNLSHSGAWALVATAPPGARVGVDVEQVRARFDHLALARRFYQPEEVARLRATGPEGFFRLWTAKEAYVKASGVGLAGMSDVLVREGSATHATVLSRSARFPECRVRWLDVAPGYAAALVTTALVMTALVTTASTPAPRTG
ncbi:4'-phosphopantetheinyl transferase family protein [Nonomuraea dietziae]|uniref:4'-phosphopantetheinyl transferase n=1 Tax=Nonomuraea dietziae TaxID=65515 RepID=A0A7W5UV75_9ACTN|nr:4'-phosphopantetheinyl transferase superfamily protein [Nonomuraea dietziae]MBB3725251.1 4'-phosphopantetheinyl transferase [Nonomuraea dietziae]